VVFGPADFDDAFSTWQRINVILLSATFDVIVCDAGVGPFL